MYRCNGYSVPNNTGYSQASYRNSGSNSANGYYDERGFWIPFVVGGLAGGALGYGVANNNFLSNNYNSFPRPYPGFCPGPGPCMMPYPYF